jgi:hypothetical protein
VKEADAREAAAEPWTSVTAALPGLPDIATVRVFHSASGPR